MDGSRSSSVIIRLQRKQTGARYGMSHQILRKCDTPPEERCLRIYRKNNEAEKKNCRTKNAQLAYTSILVPTFNENNENVRKTEKEGLAKRGKLF